MARSSWAVLAVLSLAAGVVVAMQPDRSRDFLEVRRWFDTWQFGAAHPYVSPEHQVNYPPHAFLLLFPIAFGAPVVAAHVFAFFNAAFCVLAAWWTVRVVRGATDRSTLLLLFVVLSMGLFRSAIWLGQTMPLAWWLLMVSVDERSRRPALAGVCLGLATFKPNLAVAFVLLMLWWRQWRVLTIAGVTVAGLTAAYAFITEVPIVAVVSRYVDILIRASTETGYFRDALGLGTIIQAPAWQTLFYASAVGTLVVIAWLAATRRLSTPETMALVCLWTTQTVGQQRFNIILAVPAVVILLSSSRAMDRWIGWAAAFCLVVDPPLLARLARWPDPSVAFWGSFAVALLGWLLWRAQSLRAMRPT